MTLQMVDRPAFAERPLLRRPSMDDARARLRAVLEQPVDCVDDLDIAREFGIEFIPARTSLKAAPGAGPHLSLVLYGFVQHQTSSRHQKSPVSAIFTEGEWFESHRRHQRAALTVAVVDSWVAWIPASAIEMLIETRPAASRPILRGVTAALVAANDAANTLALADTAARVAHLLLDLERRFGRSGAGQTFVEHHLTQSDIGNICGCSRETANKILADFAQRGVLAFQTKAFELYDREWLVRRAR